VRLLLIGSCMAMPISVTGRDSSKALRRSRFRLQRFRFAIPRRSMGDQRFKKMMRGMGHVIHCAIECFFVCARWLCKSGKFPNKLER
jgi:hypothetical protein